MAPVRFSVSVGTCLSLLLSTPREPSQAGWHRAAQRCGDLRRLAETSMVRQPTECQRPETLGRDKQKARDDEARRAKWKWTIPLASACLVVVFSEFDKLIRKGGKGGGGGTVPSESLVGRMTQDGCQDASLSGIMLRCWEAQLVKLCLGRLCCRFA